MSQISMQALVRPRASSRSGIPPIGASKACRIAAAASGTFGSVDLRMTAGSAADGSDTGNVPRPKAISIVLCLVTVIRTSKVIYAYLATVPIDPVHCYLSVHHRDGPGT
jgi:hypothetical protein